MGNHWLYQWIDEYSVTSTHDAESKLRLPGPVARLHELASGAPGWTEGDEPNGKSIVAGSTIDFSGRLNCTHSTCLGKQVDRLFSNIWHYFDSVVVEGPSSSWYLQAIENGTSRGNRDFLWSAGQDIDFLLSLRKLGITDHLTFRTKAHQFCTHHIEEHATEAGISHFFQADFRAEMVDRLKRESNISISGSGRSWHYSLYHPESPEPFSGYFQSHQKKGKQIKKPTKRQVAEAVVRRSTAALVYDVATSKHLSLPLAVELPYLQVKPEIATAGKGSRESQIALDLPLPVMRGMSARDVVLLRQDLRPHFDRFQYALTEAIREQLARDPERANTEVAKAVSEEFIRPAFAEIERGLSESKRSLSVKAGSSVAVGTAVASAGLLTSVPLIIGAGLAAVGVTLSGLHKHFDDRKEVKTSDVYFLWKAKNGTAR
ncbi:hypothetical protein [Streptomyces sp. NPDC088719]|uniref:hypothetical protein n=1 Tax=Streptomyces sp. NPDC088719 TaxID=3365872 RepID=UPI00382E03D4